ncbi:MAG: sigma 54-interacting transcriptional regulator [Chitinophagales bacterium]
MSLRLEAISEEMVLFPILDSITEGLVIVDPDLKILFVNSTAEQFLQVAASKIVGECCSELFPQLGLEKSLVHNGRNSTSTAWINDRCYMVNAGLIGSKSQKFGAYAILRPLENLPRQHLETFLENPYEGILIIDRVGNITFANQVCYSFLNSHQLDDLRNKVEPFLPNDCLNQVLLSGKPVSGDSVLIKDQKIDITYLPVMEDEFAVGVIVKCRVASSARDWNYYIEKLSNGTARYSIKDIIGCNPQLLAQKEMARRAARTTSTILITGESGTGKEVFAHAIHNSSPRRNAPFVEVNCAALPESLLESELFGYAEGAFTGARKGGKPGKFELANNGTIFLDEVADMSPAMQAKLLRALQEKEVEPVGSTKTIRVDVRVIAASNQNLESLVAEGSFREDLYYRLNVIVINLPPLRDRSDDVDLLAYGLLERLNRDLGTSVTKISPDVIDLFAA